MMLLRIALATAIATALAGCSWFSSSTRSNEYKGAQARVTKPLEVPPELTAPTMDDRYAIPDPRAQTTYSAYSQRTATPQAAAGGTAVLPKVEGARIERAGDQRWLVVKGEAEAVWPMVRDFWVEAGYPLTREQPEIGILETEWHEDRSKIPEDIVRRTIGRVLDRMYSTGRRDKFRTRLEKGLEPGTTEVFVSNRAMEEIYVTQSNDYTRWNPLPADRELEAEMLTRMQAKIAGDNAAKLAQASTKATAPTRATQAPVPETRNAVLENAGAGPLVVNDSFDRAWRRVGLALDRVGFTVEDRDRSKGLFFVRYIDPEADARVVKKDESFVDKLMFWRAPAKTSQPQYRIHVSDAGANVSQVQVQNAQGGTETSSTGKRILSLLYDQLK